MEWALLPSSLPSIALICTTTLLSAILGFFVLISSLDRYFYKETVIYGANNSTTKPIGYQLHLKNSNRIHSSKLFLLFALSKILFHSLRKKQGQFYNTTDQKQRPLPNHTEGKQDEVGERSFPQIKASCFTRYLETGSLEF